MKMKRVLAKDTRTALALIKQSLGDDAVILSNNKVAGEIEIIAAVDYDEKLALATHKPSFSDHLSANLGHIKPQKKPEDTQHKAATNSTNVTCEPYLSSHFSDRLKLKSINPEPVNPEPINPKPINDNMTRMEKELGLLRLLVEQQMSQTPSQNNNYTRASAIKISQRFEYMGFDKRLINSFLTQFKACDDADLLWDHAQKWLQDKLNTRSEGVVDKAGIYALVGPTGVGKTTAIGKLGAQLAMKYGKRKVALISMDQSRVDARDQLRIFGDILGIDVHHVSGFTELTEILHQLAHKDYILVDTSGGNPFGPHLQSIVDGLLGVPYDINVYLTLSANSQAYSLGYLMNQYLGQVKGVVATKLDECLPLGGLLAALIESKQPLAMITDGQRIPLDLGYPSAQQLVAYAVAAGLAQQEGSVEDLPKLHCTPKRPLWPRQSTPTNVMPLTNTGVARGQAKFKSHSNEFK